MPTCNIGVLLMPWAAAVDQLPYLLLYIPTHYSNVSRKKALYVLLITTRMYLPDSYFRQSSAINFSVTSLFYMYAS